jgi:hypothetical protein
VAVVATEAAAADLAAAVVEDANNLHKLFKKKYLNPDSLCYRGFLCLKRVCNQLFLIILSSEVIGLGYFLWS